MYRLANGGVRNLLMATFVGASTALVVMWLAPLDEPSTDGGFNSDLRQQSAALAQIFGQKDVPRSLRAKDSD